MSESSLDRAPSEFGKVILLTMQALVKCIPSMDAAGPLLSLKHPLAHR